MPRSSTWAAAARPTGPAPITATVFGARDIILILLEGWNLRANLSCSRVRLLTDRRAVGLSAALIHQEPHQTSHDRVVGLAVKRGCIALLGDESHDEQRLDVVRQG